MKRSVLQRLQKEILVYDGAMGTLLLQEGLSAPECPEELNLSKPSVIRDMHRLYVDAGADIVEANTFGGSRLRLRSCGLGDRTWEVNYSGVKIAKEAVGKHAYVAASLGPLGKLIEPLGELGFDEALACYSEQVKAFVEAGADIIIIETIMEIKELKAAILAARLHSDVPIQAQMTYDEGGRTYTGTPSSVAVVVSEAMGADIIGANCSIGPDSLLPILEEMSRLTSRYLSVLPNAGLPRFVDGKTVYDASPEYMAEYAARFAEIGINVIGGCCGTTPAHIKAIAAAVKKKKPQRRSEANVFRLASRTRVVEAHDRCMPIVIGERINPTSRDQMTRELQAGKMIAVKREAIEQVRHGTAVLDVNVSIPEIDEAGTMEKAVSMIQSVTDVPLSLDTPNRTALEVALRQVSGKPLINSVSGDEEVMDPVLELAVRYGAAVIALTIDKKGIPETAEERIAIAERIVERAKRAGLQEKDILVDPLTLSVSAHPSGARETLRALHLLREKGWYTVLGISNISHGLPNRSALNAAFLAMALQEGLTATIVNPTDGRITEALNAAAVLAERDPAASHYIASSGGRDVRASDEVRETSPGPSAGTDVKTSLRETILCGDKEIVPERIDAVLARGMDPMEINMTVVIPALEEVGKRFERKEYFLPQVMLSSECAQIAAQELKRALKGKGLPSRGRIVIATVEGDVHDIGKNIVIAVLENYGYEIYDLGKSVSCNTIISEAVGRKAHIIGLSALMTTTIPQMEVVIKEVQKRGLDVCTLVGGAVITEAYAKKIGASGYAKDAVNAVSVVEALMNKIGQEAQGKRRSE